MRSAPNGESPSHRGSRRSAAPASPRTAARPRAHGPPQGYGPAARARLPPAGPGYPNQPGQYPPRVRPPGGAARVGRVAPRRVPARTPTCAGSARPAARARPRADLRRPATPGGTPTQAARPAPAGRTPSPGPRSRAPDQRRVDQIFPELAARHRREHRRSRRPHGPRRGKGVTRIFRRRRSLGHPVRRRGVLLGLGTGAVVATGVGRCGRLPDRRHRHGPATAAAAARTPPSRASARRGWPTPRPRRRRSRRRRRRPGRRRWAATPSCTCCAGPRSARRCSTWSPSSRSASTPGWSASSTRPGISDPAGDEVLATYPTVSMNTEQIRTNVKENDWLAMQELGHATLGPADVEHPPALRGDGGLLGQPPQRHQPVRRRLGRAHAVRQRRDPRPTRSAGSATCCSPRPGTRR